uniref:Methyl-CpG-binding domain protein 1-like n=1 Tax=Scleropages formosus TaxID=113540 RepID=A0A8C9RGK5_SCLFO
MNEELLNSPVTARSPREQSARRGRGMDEHGGADKATVATTDEVKLMGNRGAGSVGQHGSQSSLESLQKETQSSPGDMAAHSQELICGVTSTEEVGEGSAGSREGAGAPKDEPPEDWLEPLEEDDEDDDRQSWELDILPGEILAGSERNFKKKSRSNSGVSAPKRRRRQNIADEEWEEWPVLGEGWKRKEVFRRSGFSVGKTDTYYMSPSGDRFRSKIELTKHLFGVMDLSTFDFKSGKFLDAITYRKMRRRRKVDVSRFLMDQSPINSEQSVFSDIMGPVDCCYSPDAPLGHLHGAGSQRHQPMSFLSSGSLQKSSTSSHSPYSFSTPPCSVQASPLQVDVAAQCPGNTTSLGPGKVTSLGCSTADMSSGEPPFHHLDPSEPGPSLAAGNPWLPCGQCRACLVTEDCGTCASCRNGLLNPDSRKPVRCRRRKCLCPIRKVPSRSVWERSVSSLHALLQGGPKKRNRRSCGMCNACLHTTDCGSCDFCIDKPKFGGSNKKRQKCRLRQCQRQAMRHLLPFQLGKSEYLTPEGWVGLGRPRPHYQYGARRGRSRKSEALWDDMEFTDDENEEGYMAIFKPGFHGPYLVPCTHILMLLLLNKFSSSDFLQITQIFSLADNAQTGVGTELPINRELLQLLEDLRRAVLPVHWVGLIVEGPRLQLVQCSKLSTMADTVVQIESGFHYQVSVQDQPLLLTHPLYEVHPSRLVSVVHVVSLLLDLERYAVCQGYPVTVPWAGLEPTSYVRAATCDFLVPRTKERCAKCSVAPLRL